jgi:hypothetical protein
VGKGSQPKISITNIGGILHRSAHVRKQGTLKTLCFVICVEDYHKLTQKQSNPVPPGQSAVRVDKNVVCLSSVIILEGFLFHFFHKLKVENMVMFLRGISNQLAISQSPWSSLVNPLLEGEEIWQQTFK